MSSDRDPSLGLRRLLESKLDTYEKLELVVVLSKRLGVSATVHELARELQVGDDVLRRLAVDLARTGVVNVDTDDRVHFTPNPAELGVIAECALLYEADRGHVIALMSAVALDRIRGMAARSFADAFTLRKKKKKDGDG